MYMQTSIEEDSTLDMEHTLKENTAVDITCDEQYEDNGIRTTCLTGL